MCLLVMEFKKAPIRSPVGERRRVGADGSRLKGGDVLAQAMSELALCWWCATVLTSSIVGDGRSTAAIKRARSMAARGAGSICACIMCWILDLILIYGFMVYPRKNTAEALVFAYNKGEQKQSKNQNRAEKLKNQTKKHRNRQKPKKTVTKPNLHNGLVTVTVLPLKPNRLYNI